MKNRFTFLHRALLAAALVTAVNFSAQAQSVGIGTTAPDASAALDVVASAKGVLLPRLTLTHRGNILSPATGLIIYQTDNTPGFYYNSGPPAAPVWNQIATAGGTSTGFIQNQNAADQVANFRISGNANVGGTLRVGVGATPGRVLTPSTGTHNLLAVAYGQVSTDATIVSTSGNYTVLRTGLGVYTITFPLESGLNMVNFNSNPVTVSVYGMTFLGAAALGVATFTGGSGFITIRTFTLGGLATDLPFTFVAFAP